MSEIHTPDYERVVARLTDAIDAIPDAAVQAYATRWPVLATQVNLAMTEAARADGLIGNNPLRMMYDNHACHALFVQSALRLRSAPNVANVIVWVYRSYIRRGFAPDYFVRELEAWRTAIQTVLSPTHAVSELDTFYRILEEAHMTWIEEAQKPSDPEPLSGDAKEFLDALLSNDETRARDTLRRRMQGAAMLPSWWEDVVTPALHRLGDMWANGDISVADEHVATMIARRVLDQAFPRLPQNPHRNVLVAVIVTPGERHDIGARMVADLVRLHGAEVLFTGADLPVESLVEMARKHAFNALLLSTTVAMNLGAVKELIATLRRELGAECPRLIVGGAAYDADPGIAGRMGADAYVATMRDILATLELVPQAMRAS